jgi:dihydrofolate reductase
MPPLGSISRRNHDKHADSGVADLRDGWAGSDDLPGFFGYMGPELGAWMAAESAVEHLALMGRKSYEMMNDLADEAKDDEWEKMTQQDTVVFSRTLTSVDWPAARVADDLIAETKRLKDTGDVPLRTVGSPTSVCQLVDAGLVDRLRLVTFPLFAGPSGREWAFNGIASADLELADHRIPRWSRPGRRVSADRQRHPASLSASSNPETIAAANSWRHPTVRWGEHLRAGAEADLGLAFATIPAH